MFLWKQLGLPSASRYPRHKVQLIDGRSHFSPKLMIWLHDSRPYKDEEAPPMGYGAEVPAAAFICMDLHPSHHMRLKSWGDGHHITADLVRSRPLTGNTGSSVTMRRIVDWLRHCDSNHPQCKPHSTEPFVPTRLVDVIRWHSHNAVRLVGSQDFQLYPVRYVALSHRWSGQVRATSTLKTNISTRLAGLETSDLPKCFTDAFEATANVGFRYIWIDSLCIVQDDSTDWEREASLMSKVYCNAAFTISASLEHNEETGLFREFSVENDYAELPVVNEDGTSTNVGFYKDRTAWIHLVARGPLQSRGWCLQERELSPRIVHWTAEQVAWECRTWSMSEYRPGQYLNVPSTIRAFDKMNTASIPDLLNMWHTLVERYSPRALSVAADCFPALAGLARVMNERLKSEYIAGFWTMDLARSLLWRTYRGGHKRNVAPSWSWAAVNGHVTFEYHWDITEQLSKKVKGLATITHHQVDLCTADPYGAVKSGSLHLRAPLLIGYLVKDISEDRCRFVTSLINEPKYGYVDLDDQDETQQPHAVTCIALFAESMLPGRRVDFSGDRASGIALVPVEEASSTYRRVGHAWDLRMELFAEAEVEDIVIV